MSSKPPGWSPPPGYNQSGPLVPADLKPAPQHSASRKRTSRQSRQSHTEQLTAKESLKRKIKVEIKEEIEDSDYPDSMDNRTAHTTNPYTVTGFRGLQAIQDEVDQAFANNFLVVPKVEVDNSHEYGFSGMPEVEADNSNKQPVPREPKIEVVDSNESAPPARRVEVGDTYDEVRDEYIPRMRPVYPQDQKLFCTYSKPDGYGIKCGEFGIKCPKYRDDRRENPINYPYLQRTKEVHIGIVREDLDNRPGDKQFKNPTIPYCCLFKIFNCPNTELFKSVSVTYSSSDLHAFLVHEEVAIFPKLKDIYLEDCMYAIEPPEENKRKFEWWRDDFPRDGDLWESVAPFRLLMNLLLSRELETLSFKSLIVDGATMNAFDGVFCKNEKIKNPRYQYLKKLRSLHLESVAQAAGCLDRINGVVTAIIKNANVVPALFLHIQKYAFGVNFLPEIPKMNLIFQTIKLQISMDTITVDVVKAIDSLQPVVRNLQLQFYVPLTAGSIDHAAVHEMCTKFPKWKAVTEVTIGKELDKIHKFNQDECMEIIRNLDKLPRLKTLAVNDRRNFRIHQELCFVLMNTKITHLTLSMTYFKHDAEKIQNWFQYSIELFKRLPRTIEELVCYGMPINKEIATEIAQRYRELKSFKMRHAVHMYVDEPMIRKCFEDANNTAAVDFAFMELVEYAPTPVEYWLDIDRTHASESPLEYPITPERVRIEDPTEPRTPASRPSSPSPSRLLLEAVSRSPPKAPSPSPAQSQSSSHPHSPSPSQPPPRSAIPSPAWSPNATRPPSPSHSDFESSNPAEGS